MTACNYDIKYENRILTIDAVNRDFDSSRIACQGYGGDLAIVNDEFINNVLNCTLQWTTYTWIGLRDSFGMNSVFQYVWVNGTVAMPYVNWGLVGPHEDDCVIMTLISGTYKWVNYPCSVNVYSLCEKCKYQ